MKNGGNVGLTVAVHLNQIALEPKGTKQAVITTGQSDPIENVTIRQLHSNETTSLNFTLSEEFPDWGANKSYFLVDFSELEEDGEYLLSAYSSTGVQGDSAPFIVAENALFDLTMGDVFRYLFANRHTDARDRAIPVIDTGKIVDVFGGWNDAGGDPGKYLSHLTYSNFFTPQQASFVAWSILSSWQHAKTSFTQLGLSENVLEEAWWGADYLHRVLSDEGFFYMTVFDRWGRDKNRYITGYKGLEGEYTPNYQAAFREGGGVAIAALARAAGVAVETGACGEFTGEQYLADAIRAFKHLEKHNTDYCHNGKENIIDDYTALLAAVELFRVTSEDIYLRAARARMESLVSRINQQGFFIADEGERPFYHAVEAGFPVVSLLHYYAIEHDDGRRKNVLESVALTFQHQLQLDAEQSNPFSYPRQYFRTYDFKNQCYSSDVLSGFFIPHENETGYWWQGENARLASLAAAAKLASAAFRECGDAALVKLAQQMDSFAQAKTDWILGKNPYGLCMMFGFGKQNPPYSKSGGTMVKGGISNGFTGNMNDARGGGIDFAAGDEDSNWRWVEQWTPHAAWYLYATSLGIKPAA